ncbi:putative c6 zinc finger domain protein [Neofusicoccum parvum UCRNP2]|uniref:Putative c6 zinc finger domain protein n=1 Tax=Botryosphaeria parva (strain UCR-NP2) TaxID=1287680 RepID=R1GSU2_BOTPV|nr:putative c6 zinc finger domain protein [Neofusicoccum parvum UCRNP2]
MTATHIATILLLLTSDLIAAGSDFQILFGILKRLVDMSGNSKELRSGDTGSFLAQQVQKLCFYGEPFLREATDTELVTTGFSGAIESFHAQLQRNPEHSSVIIRLIGLIEQARDIYVHRALNDLPSDTMKSMVDRFLGTAGDIPVSSPGGHSLVWAYFIVAAESSDPHHRKFFIRKLRELWTGTGFANTLTAIVELRRIWTIGSGQRWTYVLPSMAQTFVM